MRLNLSHHILPNSSMMLGVCMTVISIIKVVGIQHGQHRIAEVFALDLVCFLISATLSYASMRRDSPTDSASTLELLADVAFMVGLLIMTCAGVVLAYEIF